MNIYGLEYLIKNYGKQGGRIVLPQLQNYLQLK